MRDRGKTKVYVVGLDGATFDLILPWAQEGKLPAFQRLMEEGVWGELESVPNQRSAAAWTSFMTGKNPGKHGIFEFYEPIPRTYDIRFINGAAREGRTLWGILSQEGWRVGVVNVPMTYPAEAVNGFLLAGLDAPGIRSRGSCYPPDLFSELLTVVGGYTLEPGITGYVVKGELDRAAEMLCRELEEKVAAAHYLLQAYSPELFVMVFRSLDAAQHCFWKFIDPRHPDFREEDVHRYGDVIFGFYQRVDTFLRDLLIGLEEDASLIVMSDHGFGRKHPASNQLNRWLEEEGFLCYEGRSEGPSPDLLHSLRECSTRILGAAYRQVIGKTPRRVKEELWRFFPRLRDRIQTRLCLSGIDWSRTAAYSDTLFPAIRLNLRGREPLGIVEPGREYTQIVAHLQERLSTCRDSETGEKIVQGVFRREELYWGPHVEKAPDLLVRWWEDLVIHGIQLKSAVSREDGGSPFIPGEDHRVISGDHHLQGVFLALGKGIRRGSRVEGARIVDLAPTLLYRMGVPVPEEMDGEVLWAIFKEDFPRANPLTSGQEPERGPATGDGGGSYTPEETEELERRLRALGYVE